uniref:FYF2 n=1 Tax=Monotropa hypopitys TaxID=176248 RepID=A0A1Q1N9Y3_9ERIC|nr:FYF2 [Monotropa hypopitys]
MVRGKTQLKRIENTSSRQVTFSKRKSGLLKKAFELSVLCDAEVGLIIFSTSGKLYEFSSSNINKTIERYQRNAKNLETRNKANQDNLQKMKEEVVSMSKKIEFLEVSKRKLLGDCVGSCSVDDLQQIEEQLEKSLSNIRERKNLLFKQKIEQMKEEERTLIEENAKLRERFEKQPPPRLSTTLQLAPRGISQVETELFIGPPEPQSNG